MSRWARAGMIAIMLLLGLEVVWSQRTDERVELRYNNSVLTVDEVLRALTAQGIMLTADDEPDTRAKTLHGTMPERYLFPDRSRLWIYAVPAQDAVNHDSFGSDPNYGPIRMMSDAPSIYAVHNVLLLYMHPSETNPIAPGWDRRGDYRESIAAAIDPLYGDLVLIGLNGALTNRDRFLAFAAHVQDKVPDYIRVQRQGGDSVITHDLAFDGKRLRYTYHDSMNGKRVQSIGTTIDCTGIVSSATMNGEQYGLTGCNRKLPYQPPEFRLAIPSE